MLSLSDQPQHLQNKLHINVGINKRKHNSSPKNWGNLGVSVATTWRKINYDPTIQLRWNIVLMKVTNKQKSFSLEICLLPEFWDTGDPTTLLLLKGMHITPHPAKQNKTKQKERFRGIKREEEMQSKREREVSTKDHKRLRSSWGRSPLSHQWILHWVFMTSSAMHNGLGDTADA